MDINVAKIFEERPKQWGLRGDSYLWDDFEKYFSNISIPYSEEDFRKEIYSMFEKYTGFKIDCKDYIDIPQYSHGGMSSGMISQDFWLNKALPLLIKHLHKLNREKDIMEEKNKTYILL